MIQTDSPPALFQAKTPINPSMFPRVISGGNSYPGGSTSGNTSNDHLHHLDLRFTGTAGEAVVSKTSAYLITDSRYWLQAQDELDSNWHIIMAGAVDAPKDWIEWLIVSLVLPLSVKRRINAVFRTESRTPG
jgi:hypothetical protein